MVGKEGGWKGRWARGGGRGDPRARGMHPPAGSPPAPLWELGGTHSHPHTTHTRALEERHSLPQTLLGTGFDSCF